jgi:type VI secretion system protein ImpA
VSLDTLTQAAGVLAQCSTEARALSETWSERLPGRGPDFTELRRLITQAEQAVNTRLGPRKASAEPAAAPAALPGAAGAPGAAPTAQAPAVAARGFAGEVRSREDVIQAIDAICAYYGRAEPSSPLPLMLQRCRRLVTMTFTDILKELLPDSIANLQKIAGKLDG